MLVLAPWPSDLEWIQTERSGERLSAREHAPVQAHRIERGRREAHVLRLAVGELDLRLAQELSLAARIQGLFTQQRPDLVRRGR